MEFANSSGFRMAFDLNAMTMRLPNGSWDSRDAETILQRVRQRQQPLWAVQLGNEPGHYLTRNPGSVTAKQHGRDFVQLSALLDQVFADAPESRPRIQGPDICAGAMNDTSPCADMAYLRTLLQEAAGVIDDVTVHRYALQGPKADRPGECTVADFIDPTQWEAKMSSVLVEWRAMQMEIAPAARMVLSESATAGDGGCPGLSNSFASGFFMLEKLAIVARLGFWQAYRQDLVGLLRCSQ